MSSSPFSQQSGQINSATPAAEPVSKDRKSDTVKAPTTANNPVHINLPPVTGTQMTDLVDDWPSFTTPSKAIAQWADVTQEGLKHLQYRNVLDGLGTRENSEFVKEIPTDTVPMRILKTKAKINHANLTPDRIAAVIHSSFSNGSSVTVPLWHSGFWIKMRAPEEHELLSLHQEVHSLKRVLGRSTVGLIYSANRVYIEAPIIELIANLIEQHSIKIPDNTSVIDHILSTDKNWLTHALACAIWPNGYEYSRPCVADVKECQHVVTDTISPIEMQRVDKSALSSWQKEHMLKRSANSMSIDSVLRYRDEFLRGTPRIVRLNDTTRVRLKICSVTDQIVRSRQWVDHIEDTYSTALTLPTEEREQYVLNQARATILRNYGHFIDAFIYVGSEDSDPIEIDDREQIDNLLDTLSGNDEVRKLLDQEIPKFIQDSTIAFVAIEDYECPNCGKFQVDEKYLGKYSKLIPIDPISTFFVLVVQELRKLAQR